MEAIQAELDRFLSIYHQGQKDDYTAGIIEGLKIALEALEGQE
jgi:hypothetical protein